MRHSILFTFFLFMFFSKAQNTFDYTLEILPVNVTNLPGLHSFVFGQHENKWLLIGGRKDGLHARQPFNAFPSTSNN